MRVSRRETAATIGTISDLGSTEPRCRAPIVLPTTLPRTGVSALRFRQFTTWPVVSGDRYTSEDSPCVTRNAPSAGCAGCVGGLRHNGSHERPFSSRPRRSPPPFSRVEVSWPWSFLHLHPGVLALRRRTAQQGASCSSRAPASLRSPCSRFRKCEWQGAETFPSPGRPGGDRSPTGNLHMREPARGFERRHPSRRPRHRHLEIRASRDVAVVCRRRMRTCVDPRTRS